MAREREKRKEEKKTHEKIRNPQDVREKEEEEEEEKKLRLFKAFA